MRRSIRVYIAGPLSPKGLWNPNLAIDYLLNVRNMVESGKQCLMAGLSPFVPGIDFNFFLNLRHGEEITEQMIKDYSIDWLLACDCVLLLDKWWVSNGTLAEMDIAREHHIPMFHSVQEIVDWKNVREAADAVHNPE